MGLEVCRLPETLAAECMQTWHAGMIPIVIPDSVWLARYWARSRTAKSQLLTR